MLLSVPTWGCVIEKFFPSTAIIVFLFYIFSSQLGPEIWNIRFTQWIEVMLVRLARHYQIFMSLYMCSCLSLVAWEDWGPCSSIDWHVMGNKALFHFTIFLCCCWQLLVDCTMITGFFSPTITVHIYGNELQQYKTKYLYTILLEQKELNKKKKRIQWIQWIYNYFFSCDFSHLICVLYNWRQKTNINILIFILK